MSTKIALVSMVVALLAASGCVLTTSGPTGPVATATGSANIDWSSTLTNNDAPVGTRLGFYCPPGGTASTVWGTDVYSDDSSICTAAVHAGLITFNGGAVSLVVQPGQPGYAASERNGVSTLSYGTWGRSYSFAP